MSVDPDAYAVNSDSQKCTLLPIRQKYRILTVRKTLRDSSSMVSCNRKPLTELPTPPLPSQPGQIRVLEEVFLFSDPASAPAIG